MIANSTLLTGVSLTGGLATLNAVVQKAEAQSGAKGLDDFVLPQPLSSLITTTQMTIAEKESVLFSA